MAPVSVSDCVQSIVASFANGLDVFRRFLQLRDGGDKEEDTKKLLRRTRKTSRSDGGKAARESQLARSLHQGSVDIGREYQRHMRALGDHYAKGDAIAHVSLAEIAVRLNAGLVRIIHKFLSPTKKMSSSRFDLDYESLMSLSETSRIDTCRVLRDWCQRILHLRSSAASLPRSLKPVGQQKAAVQDARANHKVDDRRSRRPRFRQPTLARVYISDSSRSSQLALVKPGERRQKATKKGTPAASASTSTLQLHSKPAPQMLASQSMSQLPVEQHGQPAISEVKKPAKANAPPERFKPSSRSKLNAASQPDLRKHAHYASSPPDLSSAHALPQVQQLQHSMSTMNLQHSEGSRPPISARVDPAQSSPHLRSWLQSTSSLPSHDPPPIYSPDHTQSVFPGNKSSLPPPQSAAQFRPTANNMAHRVSVQTARTASTKLGEIPLHRWAERWDFEAAEEGNRRAAEEGWPVWGRQQGRQHGGREAAKTSDTRSGGQGFWSGLRKWKG